MCFHPPVEQLFEERLAMHRNLEQVRRLGRPREGTAALEPRPEPTLEEVRREYEPSPANQDEEVIELVGLCLWDIFSDNHDVIAADGRVADIGSFRGAGAFLDEYVTRDQEGWRDGDYMRFYMGTIWISRRADLMPVYALIFRRLKAAGADWVYHFPEIGIVELARADDVDKAGVSVFGVAGRSGRARGTETSRRGRAVPGGTEGGECACAGGGVGPPTARGGACVPTGVRARSTRLAAGVKAARVVEVVQFQTGNARRVARRGAEVDSCVSH
jgi:hypothetical protein